MRLVALLLGCSGCASPGDSGGGDSSGTVPSGEGLPWLSVEPGLGHACGVRSNGRAYCWGEGVWRGEYDETFVDYVLTEVPDRDDLLQVTLADHMWEYQYACALTTERRTICWGLVGRQFRQPYVAVAQGDAMLFGLREDGSLDCFYVYASEPCTPYSRASSVASFVPTWRFVFAVQTDGELTASAFSADDSLPELPAGPWSRISGQGYGDWMCGIRPGGALECFGDADRDARGLDSPPDLLAAEVCMPNGGGACALDLDGVPVCWGDAGTSAPPAGPFASLSCAADTWCGVTGEGEATCWGECGKGICELPP